MIRWYTFQFVYLWKTGQSLNIPRSTLVKSGTFLCENSVTNCNTENIRSWLKVYDLDREYFIAKSKRSFGLSVICPLFPISKGVWSKADDPEKDQSRRSRSKADDPWVKADDPSKSRRSFVKANDLLGSKQTIFVSKQTIQAESGRS